MRVRPPHGRKLIGRRQSGNLHPPNSCSESLRDSTPTGIKARQMAGRAGMFANRLKQHGINPRGGRNTAMIRLAYDLPAAIAAEGPARQIVRTGLALLANKTTSNP